VGETFYYTTVRGRQAAFPVTDGGRVVGAVTMTDPKNVDPERRPTTTVGIVTESDVTAVLQFRRETGAAEVPSDVGRGDPR
jgi:CBS domain-containing protein